MDHISNNNNNNKDNCPHFKNDIVNEFIIEIKSLLSTTGPPKKILPCSKPKCPIERGIMFCLNCGITFCSRRENKHSLEHWKECGHSVVVDLLNRQVWCYSCDSFIIVNIIEELFNECDSNSKSDSNNESGSENDRHSDSDDLNSTLQGTSDNLLQASMIGQIGLSNLGNSCYINSAIQCLINTPLLTSFMLNLYEYSVISDLDHSPLHKRTTPLFPLKVSYQWHLFVKEYYAHSTMEKSRMANNALSPQKIIREMKTINPSFNGYSQQDSMDFIRLFLDRIHDECSSDHGSIIDDCFGGILRSQIHCLSCDHISTKDDSFFDLSLPISYTPKPPPPSLSPSPSLSKTLSYKGNQESPPSIIEDRQSNGIFGGIFDFMKSSPGPSSSSSSTIDLEHCLASFCKKETLESSNRYRCDHCRTLVPSTKTLLIAKAPPYLCLQLKRFKHDSYYSSKINNPVQVPFDCLDLSPFMVKDKDSNSKFKYQLTGMICHHGAFNGGHYVSYIRKSTSSSSFSSSWFECNDSHLSPISQERVSRMQAYILFYSILDPMAEEVRMTLIPQIRMAMSSSGKRTVPNGWKYIPISLLNSLLNHPSPSLIRKISPQWGLCQHLSIRPPSLLAFDRLVRLKMQGKQNESINYSLLLKLLNTSPHLPPSSLYIYLPEKIFSLLSEWICLGECNDDGKVGCSCCCVSNDKKNLKQNSEWCQNCLKERMKLFVRRKMESDEISRKDGPLVGGECWFLLSNKWIMDFSRWREGKSDEPPGPIDNSVLFDSSNTLLPNLRKGQDYRGVNGDVWRYLLKQYGGGPALQRGSIDIYSSITINEPLESIDGGSGDDVVDIENGK